MEPVSLPIHCRRIPVLDPGFVPAVLWNRAFRERTAKTPGSHPLGIALERGDGSVTVFQTDVLPETGAASAALNDRYVERLVKLLLWQKGGYRVILCGSEAIAARLGRVYHPQGQRKFDHHYMGKTLFGRNMVVANRPWEDMPETHENARALGRHLDGCRIGFDLGGSDRKAAALIDGEVVYSEEIPWDPYFQSDPSYQFAGIRDTLHRAASHLPRVDAIGGSAAGVYVNNEVRAASLFRGISAEDFDKYVRRIFFRVMEAEGWADIPWEVVNDGEVTALAGSMSLGANSVLGVSMGTSEAAGYVDPDGNIRPWLNELAFVPVDYRAGAPVDEWSGDEGCGVQYFSQQAVGRLAGPSGLELPEDLPLPEKLVQVQDAMTRGDERARRIYETIGVCFGYAVAHYAEFYAVDHLLILGRVTSGEGGEVIIAAAESVLQEEFPDLAQSLRLRTPDEKNKRHGQAVAAASLPSLAV